MGAVLAGFREVHLHRGSDIHKRDPEVHKRAYDEHNSIFRVLVSRSCRWNCSSVRPRVCLHACMELAAP